MANRNYNYDNYANELLEFISSLIIKNKYLAELEETSDSSLNGLIYTLVIEKRDTFLTHQWTETELLEAGVNIEDAREYLKTKKTDLIGDYQQKILLERKRKDILENYVEENNYYRMLNGLPNLGEEPIETSLGPVTELTINQLYQLENSGELGKLINDNKNLEYLRHLGSAKVSIYDARKANPFYILNYKKYIISEEDVKIFTEIYYQNFVYVTSVLYNNAFINYHYYESFMILLTVFMTVQKFISMGYIESIKKDFYDIDSIKNTFLSYGLPFFEDIPIRYQRNIIKNLNQLLKYKGTDKVLIDIVKLFGFSNTELFKYYLIKDVKRDENGNPLIDYENVANSYELKFAQVSLSDNNITQALKNTSLYQTYEDVVEDDPFWGDGNEDESFKEQILEMEFNYINTKYISMNTVFEISKVNLETCHFFNMIDTLKGKGYIDTITFISNNLKASGNEISLFNAFTALNALMYKRFGYEDIIHNTSTSIASIYSFNFDTDLEELYNIIKKNSTIKIDNKEIEFDISTLKEFDIRDMTVDNKQLSRDELIQLFFRNMDYKDYLIARMNECNDYAEFKALESIFNYNMISNSVNNLYGNYKTYNEYLKDNDYELYSFINYNATDKESTLKTLDILLYSIESFLNSSRFDNIFSSLSNQTGNLIKTYIMKIINIFKAYTIDLQKINFYFIMEDSVWGRIRMFSFLYKYTGLDKADSLSDYLDCLEKTINFGQNIEKAKFKDNINDDEFLYLKVLLEKIEDYKEIIFKEIKYKFNIDKILADSNMLNDSNIVMKSEFNNFINKTIEFNRDKLFNNYEYLIINSKVRGGIFDDNYDPLSDDNHDYLYPNEHFE